MVSLPECYGIKHDHQIILYAGSFEPYQGLDLLVDCSPEIVRAHPNVRFLCVGGTDKQVTRMSLRAREREVTESFIFPGTVAQEEVEYLVKGASILVSPRILGTNTPLKIYSYLRSGVPIVATNIRSHTQVLTDEVALLVGPHPDSMCAGILRLLNDPQLGARLAQNARQLADECYSQHLYQSKVAEVVSFLADRGRVGR
jgi:glycosyltransferase involved in cell wall biosynthesis